MRVDVSCWHEAVEPECPLDGRFRGESGRCTNKNSVWPVVDVGQYLSRLPPKAALSLLRRKERARPLAHAGLRVSTCILRQRTSRSQPATTSPL